MEVVMREHICQEVHIMLLRSPKHDPIATWSSNQNAIYYWIHCFLPMLRLPFSDLLIWLSYLLLPLFFPPSSINVTIGFHQSTVSLTSFLSYPIISFLDWGFIVSIQSANIHCIISMDKTCYSYITPTLVQISTNCHDRPNPAHNLLYASIRLKMFLHF